MAAYVGLSQHIEFARLPVPGDRFELQELIGEGTYGEVYSARDKTTGRKVAIKILETITDNLEEIEEEFLVLRDLSHHQNLPSFVGIFLRKGACIEDDQLWFVMEVGEAQRMQKNKNKQNTCNNNSVISIFICTMR